MSETTRRTRGTPAKAYIFILALLTLGTCRSALGVDGYATADGMTTTGGAGDPSPVTVTDLASFTSAISQTGPRIIQVQGTINLGPTYVNAASQKTIVGLGTDATLVGDLRIKGANNIIIQNLTLTNPHYDANNPVGDNDGLTIIDGAHHIWVDHCNFSDCGDGQIDITKGCDDITVSWCKFSYADSANTHRLSSLVGHDDTNAAEDTGKLHITYHHNWWAPLADQRMPRVRFGCVHVYNNYYSCAGNLYCVAAAIESHLLIENNYFDGVRNPWIIYVTTGNNGRIHAVNNVEVNTTRQPFGTPGAIITDPPDTGAECPPPYSYTPDNGNDVKTIVMAGAGVGHATQPPTLISITVTPADSTLCTNKTQQFTATGIYSDNGTKDLTTIVDWASQNLPAPPPAQPLFVTVDNTSQKGLAAASTRIGSSSITATHGGISGSATVNVSDCRPTIIQTPRFPPLFWWGGCFLVALIVWMFFRSGARGQPPNPNQTPSA